MGNGGITKDNVGSSALLLIDVVTLSDNQEWNIAAGSLRITSELNTGGNSLEIKGAGTLDLRGSITYGSEITISIDRVSTTQVSTDVTLEGANSFTSLNIGRGRVSGATLGNFGEVSNFGSGGTNTAIGLGASSGAPGILNYTGVSATSERTFNRVGGTADLVNAVIEVSTVGETLTLTGALTSTTSANNGGWEFRGAGDLTIEGVISNQGVDTGKTFVNKVDAGTLTLKADNTYEGTTNVNAGTLLVNNASGSGLGSGNTVVDGGTLGGTGSFTGAVTVNSGGTLAPGASIETLGSGTVNLNTGSTFAYEVNSGVASSVGADLQPVAGDLNLSGAVTLTLADLTPVACRLWDWHHLLSYQLHRRLERWIVHL